MRKVPGALLAVVISLVTSASTVGASAPLNGAHYLTLTPAGASSCLGVPVSTLMVRPSSCWVTGPASILIAGVDSTSRDGVVVIIDGQRRHQVRLASAGKLEIASVSDGHACIKSASGASIGIELATARVSSSCTTSPPAYSAAAGRAGRTPTDFAPAAASPAPSSSLYVFGSYIDPCGPAATTGCPMYNAGLNEAVPSTGGLTILDFGAPCFDPSTLVWGAQTFNSQSCVPDSVLATLAQAWIRGYEANPNRSTSSPYIVALGTSNSLTAAVPGNALSPAQMAAHGRAWFNSVVSPVAGTVAGLAAPVTVWSGSDIEESSDGNWYDGPTSNAWVDGYTAASGASKPCASNRTGLMVDYGDFVPNEPGWSVADVYHDSFGAASACPFPEIYFTANAGEWQSLNHWAQSVGLPGMIFTAVLSEDSSGGSLSAAGSWNALQSATGQSAPYLSVIGSAGGPPAQPPDVPTGLTAVAGPGSATISWSAPAWDGGSRITSYTVTAFVGGASVQTVTSSGWPVPKTAVMQGLTNGTAYTFTVSAGNAAGAGPSSPHYGPVTPSQLLPYTTASKQQYHLTSSDGVNWIDIDSQALSLTIQPTVSAQAVITATADLWTADAGVNQDLGVAVNGSVVAWKESGGSSGTFSPNAAAVTAVVPVSSGTPYTVKLQWKSNRPASGATIYDGAGPTGGPYSPTRLTVQLIPTAANIVTSPITTQPSLANSDGTTWANLDGQNLVLNYTPSASGTVLLTGNADLWTNTAGVNQDLAIAVNGSRVAWKESGGAGAYSPNAALVQTAMSVTSGTQYVISLQWKTNRNSPGVTIFAGAGKSGGPFSPTSLTLRFVASGLTSAVSTTQYRFAGSDGGTWNVVDSTSLTMPATSSCVAVISANADLWTSTGGNNEDLAIVVTTLDAIAYPNGIVDWKESSGAAAFSPNAAYVQAVIGLTPGRSYTVTLAWKANHPAGGAAIFSGAGTNNPFSPTSLTVEVSC